MFRNQLTLLKHLRRDGRLMVYLRFLAIRHRKTLAYLLLTVIILAAVAYTNHNAVGRERHERTIAIEREDRATIRTCERVQILRDQTNGLSFIAYDAWAGAAKREKGLIKTTKGKVRETHRASYKSLQDLADSMIVTGPTDCRAATYRPDIYRPPAPEFIASGGPAVAIARKRSRDIIERAKLNEPLFDPLPEDLGGDANQR
jgi:hypothetical protein